MAQNIENRELEVKDLLPGDLMLSMASSEFAKLIGWVGDVEFSHASVVYDRQQLIEATLPKVQLDSLDNRSRKGDKLCYLEVLRPTHKLTEEDEAALRGAGERYLGRNYSKGTLVQLAVTAAIRNKVPLHPALRLLFKWIVSKAIKADPKELVCTELAYRVYSEGKYHTKGIKPILPDVPPRHPPIPDFDYLELFREIYEMLHPDRPAAGAAAEEMRRDFAELEEITDTLAELSRQKVDFMSEVADQAANDRTRQALLDSYAELIGKLDDAARTDAAIARDENPLSVNPKTILLIELWESPSFEKIGRLRLTKGN